MNKQQLLKNFDEEVDKEISIEFKMIGRSQLKYNEGLEQSKKILRKIL